MSGGNNDQAGAELAGRRREQLPVDREEIVVPAAGWQRHVDGVAGAAAGARPLEGD